MSKDHLKSLCIQFADEKDVKGKHCSTCVFSENSDLPICAGPGDNQKIAHIYYSSSEEEPVVPCLDSVKWDQDNPRPLVEGLVKPLVILKLDSGKETFQDSCIDCPRKSDCLIPVELADKDYDETILTIDPREDGGSSLPCEVNGHVVGKELLRRRPAGSMPINYVANKLQEMGRLELLGETVKQIVLKEKQE